MRARNLLLALAAGLACGPAGAQVARLSVSDSTADGVRVGQPFQVLLVVRPPDGTYPILPMPQTGTRRDSTGLALGDALVSGATRRAPAFSGGARVDSVLYTVAVFQLDTAAVGPIEVGLVAGTDTAYVTAAFVAVPVIATTTPADSLRPPAPPMEIPRAWGPTALAVLGAIAALAIGVRAWKRRGRARPASRHRHLPPYEEALARIDALDRMPIASAADVEAHDVELADAVRTYLERELSIDATRLTTSELAGPIGQKLPGDTAALLLETLRETDLVKFAAMRPDAAALAATRTRARTALKSAHAATQAEPAA